MAGKMFGRYTENMGKYMKEHPKRKCLSAEVSSRVLLVLIPPGPNQDVLFSPII